MSLIRQFFRTSESDKDDCLIINPLPKQLDEVKNRKCSKADCELPIKDKKKVKHHLKESKTDLAKNKPTNQSSFYVLINNGEEFDQENKIKVFIDQCSNDQNELLNSSNQKNGESKKDLNKEKHIYQNESIVRATVDIIIENQDYQFDDQQKKQKTIINNPQVEKHKIFPPKPLKMIKKRLKKPKEIISDNQLNCQLNSPKMNSQLNKQSFGDQDDKSILNETKNQRRRRQDHSFENLNDRLEFISLTSASTKLNKKEHDQLRPIYKSEDNLLSIVPNAPRSMSRLNRINLKNDNQDNIQNNTQKDHLSSEHLQFYSKNPIYRSFEFERIRERVINTIKSKESHDYVNDLKLDELIARPRKCDLISLRELKPRQFLTPEKPSDVTSETNELTYVNLEFDKQFDKQTNDESNEMIEKDEINEKTSSSTNNLKNDSTSKLINKIKNDLSKSTVDLELLRSAKPPHLKQNKQQYSKSDDDECKVEYCKIDLGATQSLIKIKEHRIKNNHL